MDTFMCEFCQIINKERTAYIVYEDEKLVSFLDADPINEGHVLVVPKEHVDSLDKMQDNTLSDVMSVSKKIVKALCEIYGSDGYSIMQNGGKFCDYGHIHFHILDVYKRQGL